MSVRASLRSSCVEGVFAELVGACASGGVLTAWALALGLSPALFGILGALPYAAHMVQMPAAWISRRFGARRTAVLAISVSRQMVLPLIALPFLHAGLRAQQGVFLAVAFSSAALGIVGNNAWTTWMSDLVPARIRGRYFGRRTALCALASTLADLAAGAWLDGAHGGAVVRLAVLAALASVSGAVTSWLLIRQGDRLHAVREPPALRDVVAPLKSRPARRFLAFQLAWSFASGIAAAFYPLHMIGNLRMGFTRMALYNSGIAAAGMVGAPLFGRALDRLGSRPVLIACAAMLCISPVIWLFPTPDSLWPLAFDAALCGFAMAGYNLAAFSLPSTLAPPRDRSFLFAAIATTGGVATAIASTAGGGAVRLLPAHAHLFGHPLVAVQVLFLAGGCARAVSLLFALRIEERGARPVADLARFALRRMPQRREKLAA